MSFRKEIYKEIKNKIDSKSNIIISGNIDDTFMVPDRLINKELGKEDFELNTLHEIVYEHLKKEGYDKVALVDRYGENKQIGFKLVNGKREETMDQISFEKDFLKEYIRKDPKQKIAIVINFVESIMKDKEKDPHSESAGEFKQMVVDMIDTNFNSGLDYINDNRKIILITKNPDVLFNRLVSKNIELGKVIVPKPDSEERELLIKKFAGEFNIKYNDKNPLLDENTNDFKDAVALTDDFSLKEIFQIIKLSKAQQFPLESFKELYNLFTISKTTSPWEQLRINSEDELLKTITKKVKGQDNAAKHVVRTIIKAITGLSGIQHNVSRSKPKGIAFFVGPTGVGKTEMAKAITNLIFHDENNLIRFDMSEYKQDNSDQRLIGSPPGYVGYAEGGQLTNAVKEKPFSVILFDEVEKANKKIFDIFLQILEDGRLTSSQGETINFSETFIIFTSNIGAEKDKGNVTPNYLEEVKTYFRDELGRPEIFGRINESNIITFNRINNQIAGKIIEFKIDSVIKYIKKVKNIQLNFNDDQTKEELINLILEKYDSQYGGRDAINKIEDILIGPLSNYIFTNDLNNLDELTVVTIKVDNQLKKVKFEK